MRKKILPFITIAIMVFFAACNNEDLLPEANAETKIEGTRTLSLTASMPGENPTTRIALEQESDKSITLTWQAGDTLQFAFEQGGVKIKDTIILMAEDISLNGKSAEFNIDIPSQFTSGQFNLYGVYGGGGLSDDNPTNIKLPANTGRAGLLSGVQDRKDVVLYFASEVDIDNPQVSVNFKHLGSLFSITFFNDTDTDIEGYYDMRIGSEQDPDYRWAFNTDDGGQFYNLENEEFHDKVDGSGWYISFNAQDITFPSKESVTLWSWYPPLPNINWPTLYLGKQETEDGPWTVSENNKPARNAPTAPGMSYYFYAKWDGTNLNFTDDQFNIPSTLTIDVQLPTTN